MLSTEFFFIPSKRINPLHHITGNEVSALERFTCYENLLIGQEKVSVVLLYGYPY